MSHKRARSDPEQQQQSVQQQQQQQIDIQQQEAHSQDEPDLPVAAVLLESEDQVEAAEAVIAALYGVSTATDNLTGCHLVHMVVLADMLQVEAAAEAAACRLTQVAHELSAEARQQLCAMQAWPACLMKELPSLLENFPLQDAAALWAKAAAPSTPASLEDLAAQHSDYMQNRLVQELGNLEEVWSDADQPQLLLGLPLPAMQLLLASDDLQVGYCSVLRQQRRLCLSGYMDALGLCCLHVHSLEPGGSARAIHAAVMFPAGSQSGLMANKGTHGAYCCQRQLHLPLT